MAPAIRSARDGGNCFWMVQQASGMNSLQSPGCRWFAPGLWVICLAAAAAVASRYPLYSHTMDEPAHIMAGLEWLDRGTYTAEHMHVPLARILAALGPWIDGARVPAGWNGDLPWAGVEVLMDGDGERYRLRLTLARLGLLPLFLIGIAATGLLARRIGGPVAGLLAAVLFAVTPPVMTNAMIATTDLAVASLIVATIWAFVARWDRPDMRLAAVLGLAGALAVGSKLTALIYLPAASVVFLAALAHDSHRRWRTLARGAAVALPVAAVTLWALYRFSLNGWVPAPEFWSGLQEASARNAHPNTAIIFGELRPAVW